MHPMISQRALVLATCLAAFTWTGPVGAKPLSFKVPLAPAHCVPPVQTGADGTADLTYDPATRKVTWDIEYRGLSSPATMAHFHGPAAPGKNGPIIIWLTTQGTPPKNPITGQAILSPTQAGQFAAGEWYVNLHTQSHPACELRGQVILP
jgi:CHRD domain